MPCPSHRLPLWSLLSLALLAVSTARAHELTLERIELPQRGSAALSLSFVPVLEPVAAIQFDLDYDHSALELIATLGETARAAGKSLYVADISPTRRRFVVIGLNQTQILAGGLISFVAGAAADAAAQNYPLVVANVVTSSPDGVRATANAMDGWITVTTETGSPLSLAGVRSAASLLPGPIAPGELVTLFGNGIGPAQQVLPAGLSSFVLGGTSVWIGNIQAPLLYAGPSQINAVVPFGVRGDNVDVAVRKGSVVWSATQVRLQSTAPAIFTMSSSGGGAGAVLNQDSSLNALNNPARRETIVSLYVTGGGLLKPDGVDGAIASVTKKDSLLPVSVQVGGSTAEVLYAGTAPGLIEGVLQLNVRIPADAPLGPAIEVRFSVGGVSSPAGVTLAIR